MLHAHIDMVGKPEGERPLEELRSIWKENVKRTLKKQDGKLCTGFISFGIGTSGGLL
jgi:hypothetical protein